MPSGNTLRFRPRLEALEAREVPAAFWNGQFSHLWGDAQNWSDELGAPLGRTPLILDDVWIKGHNPLTHKSPVIDGIATARSLNSLAPVLGEGPARLTFTLFSTLGLFVGNSVWGGESLGGFDSETGLPVGRVNVYGGTFNWTDGRIRLSAMIVRDGAIFTAKGGAYELAVRDFRVGEDAANHGNFVVGGAAGTPEFLSSHIDTRVLLMTVHSGSTLDFRNNANLLISGGFLWNAVYNPPLVNLGHQMYYYPIIANYGTVRVSGVDPTGAFTQIQSPISIRGDLALLDILPNARAKIGPSFVMHPPDPLAFMLHNNGGEVYLGDGSRLETPANTRGYFQDGGAFRAAGNVSLIGRSMFHGGGIDLRGPTAFNTLSVWGGDMRLDGKSSPVTVHARVDGTAPGVCDRIDMEGSTFQIVSNSFIQSHTVGAQISPPGTKYHVVRSIGGGRLSGHFTNIHTGRYRIQYFGWADEEVPLPGPDDDYSHISFTVDEEDDAVPA